MHYVLIHSSPEGHVGLTNANVLGLCNTRICEVPLHNSELGIWCGISKNRIIKLIFFKDTILKGTQSRYSTHFLSR